MRDYLIGFAARAAVLRTITVSMCFALLGASTAGARASVCIGLFQTEAPIVVLDGSALLENPRVYFDFPAGSEVIIPTPVLRGLFAQSQETRTRLRKSTNNSSAVLEELNKFVGNGSLYDGVKLPGGGVLRSMDIDPTKKSLLSEFDLNDPVQRTIALVKQLTIKTRRDIRFETVDPRVNVLARAFLPSVMALEKREELLSGVRHVQAEWKLINYLLAVMHAPEGTGVDCSEIPAQPPLKVNEFALLYNSRFDQPEIVRCVQNAANGKLEVRVIDRESVDGALGINPLNDEQYMFMDLLRDPSVQIVIVNGIAGTGKTLLTLAAALEQSRARDTPYSSRYSNVVLWRTNNGTGERVGTVPGDEKEKLDPTLKPHVDNLRIILKNEAARKSLVLNNSISGTGGTPTDREQNGLRVFHSLIEVSAMYYGRGRSVQGTFIIVDETQNLTPAEIKMLITRVGEGSKIIVAGDNEQVDDNEHGISISNNGLLAALEDLGGTDAIVGHIRLVEGKRSPAATLSAKRSR